MTHEYSVQIHHWITRKINDVEAALKTADKQKDSAKKNYYSGQLEELGFIRRYLSDHVDLDTQTYHP